MTRKRWKAEITYNNGAPPNVVAFEELRELHDLVERGPDWRSNASLSPSTIRRSALDIAPVGGALLEADHHGQIEALSV
jgi:hypothetical protein